VASPLYRLLDGFSLRGKDFGGWIANCPVTDLKYPTTLQLLD